MIGRHSKGFLLEATFLVCLSVHLLTGLHESEPGLAMKLVTLAFAGVILTIPQAILYVAGRFVETFAGQAVLAAGMLAALGLWLYGWYFTFIENAKPDAQDALVFVVVPMYAGLAAMLLAGAVFVAERLMRK